MHKVQMQGVGVCVCLVHGRSSTLEARQTSMVSETCSGLSIQDGGRAVLEDSHCCGGSNGLNVVESESFLEARRSSAKGLKG